MEQIKAKFAGFLMVDGIIVYEGGRVVKTKIRINPNAITSYFGNEIEISGENRIVTTVYCGHAYHVDMPLEEFDKCMSEIDRGISFEENN